MSIKDQLRQRLELNQLSHQRAKSSDLEEPAFDAQHILISRIDPNPFQPRSVFAEHAIADLAQSIERDGLVQPVVVRPNGVRGYQLISGERRLRAFQELGRELIPAIIQPMSDEESAISALQENLKREDLTDFEVSEALIKLKEIKEEAGHSPNVTELSELISVSRPAIYRYLSFLSLPESIRERLRLSPELLSGSTSLSLERWSNTAQAEGMTRIDYEEKLTQVLDEVERGLNQNKIMSRIKRLMAESKTDDEDLRSSDQVKRQKLMRGAKQIGRWVDGPDDIKITLRRQELNTKDLKHLEVFLAELIKTTKTTKK
jgi:ParB family chromosome partitioning protein